MTDSTSEGAEILELRRARVVRRLEVMPDVELIVSLMTVYKYVQNRAVGKAKMMADEGAVVFTTAMERFAPEAFAEAVAEWATDVAEQEQANEEPLSDADRERLRILGETAEELHDLHGAAQTVIAQVKELLAQHRALDTVPAPAT